MKKLIQIVKSIKLRQVLTVFLAGSLLVISTACSNGNVAQAGGKAYTDAGRATSDTYDKYDANQPAKGGMNKYNDDPRYDTRTGAETKSLVDTVKGRQADNEDSYVDNLRNIGDTAGQKINEAKRDIPRAIEDRKEDTAQDIQRRTETLKQNLKNAPDEAKRVFNGAKDNAQGAVDDARGAAQRTTNEVKGNLKDIS